MYCYHLSTVKLKKKKKKLINKIYQKRNALSLSKNHFTQQQNFHKAVSNARKTVRFIGICFKFLFSYGLFVAVISNFRSGLVEHFTSLNRKCIPTRF